MESGKEVESVAKVDPLQKELEQVKNMRQKDLELKLAVQKEIETIKKELEQSILVYKEKERLQKEYSELQAKIQIPHTKEVILPKYETTKIFITGLYGSGKTLLAQQYSNNYKVKYINFDKYFNYTSVDNKVNAAKDFLGILSDNFITDAIPANFNFGYGFEDFLEYVTLNKVVIICTICPNPEEWIKRAGLDKRKMPKYQAFVDYVKYYYSLLNLLKHLPIVYVDTYTNEFITLEQLYERTVWIKPLLNYI